MKISLHHSTLDITDSAPAECLTQYLRTHPYSRAVLLCDAPIYDLYGAPIEATLASFIPTSRLTLPTGEQTKTLDVANDCWQEMHKQGLDRRSLVVALGGGAITDLAGFVAGCYMRGIDSLNIPTTLLGMVDAAIGGKTGINLPSGKNIVGVFHQPAYVIISPPLLQTLPEREFRSGLAEVIKYGVISDATFFHQLEQWMPSLLKRDPVVLQKVIAQCCAIKADVVQADEREQGRREILNWGHTFAHALEALTHYKQYLHGEAVSIGMGCAAQLSASLGLVDATFVQRQDRLLTSAGLPTALPTDISLDQLLHLMARDKKAIGGQIRFVLCRGFGNLCKQSDIAPSAIYATLQNRQQK